MSLSEPADPDPPLLWVEPGTDVSRWAPASPADVVSAWLPDVEPGPDLARALAWLADPALLALFAVADPDRGERTRLAPAPDAEDADAGVGGVGGGVGRDRAGT